MYHKPKLWTPAYAVKITLQGERASFPLSRERGEGGRLVTKGEEQDADGSGNASNSYGGNCSETPEQPPHGASLRLGHFRPDACGLCSELSA